MGMSCEFVCDTCGLGGTVTGGTSCGFLVHTDTRYCRACRKLFNVATAWTNFLGHERTRDDEERIRFNECPSCHSTELAAWRNGEPCPSCGGNMVMKPRSMILWD